jgi:hypothetical protein
MRPLREFVPMRSILPQLPSARERLGVRHAIAAFDWRVIPQAKR